MKIIFYDGSELECNEIYFASNDEMICDGRRRVDTIEVVRIEEGK